MVRLLCLALFCLATPLSADTIVGTIRVIDGDTIDIGKTRIRIFGIDAPETDQQCADGQGAIWECGAWVNAQVRARFEGRRAACTPLERDRYGRLVARCRVSGEDMGERIVSEGLAFAYRQYSMDYDLTEKAAAAGGRGLHTSRVQTPAEYRRSQVRQEVNETVSGTGNCAIKGNISGKGERIYHMPGQRDYVRTGIREDRGERWFCSEADARAAGWRRARR
ncbi:thermonuclease family protein [Sulfitobacter sp. LCG007]